MPCLHNKAPLPSKSRPPSNLPVSDNLQQNDRFILLQDSAAQISDLTVHRVKMAIGFNAIGQLGSKAVQSPNDLFTGLWQVLVSFLPSVRRRVRLRLRMPPQAINRAANDTTLSRHCLYFIWI